MQGATVPMALLICGEGCAHHGRSPSWAALRTLMYMWPRRGNCWDPLLSPRGLGGVAALQS